MLIKSTQKFVRMSPRKLRLVATAVKNITPAEAIARLKFGEKAAAESIAKVIKTAVANAKNNFGQDEKKLTVEAIVINAGPTLKRGKAVSRGQYHQIKRRSAHITVTLRADEAK